MDSREVEAFLSEQKAASCVDAFVSSGAARSETSRQQPQVILLQLLVEVCTMVVGREGKLRQSILIDPVADKTSLRGRLWACLTLFAFRIPRRPDSTKHRVELPIISVLRWIPEHCTTGLPPRPHCQDLFRRSFIGQRVSLIRISIKRRLP